MMEEFPELLGSIEFSRALGFDRRKFSVYLSRGKFPKPISKVGARSFWTRKQVDDYLEDLKRQKMDERAKV
jgi:predicted DNA-binding transcriptional regulator AlpA